MKTKIATWNLKRPSASTQSRNSAIVEVLRSVDADILILTETNSVIHPGAGYKAFATKPLVEYVSRKGEPYKDGENRVTIWSRLPELSTFDTYCAFSSVCVGFKTELGELNVYGTVIGSYGSRDPGFGSDLDLQVGDWEKLRDKGSFCVAGDFNISFGDNFYFTKAGREKINGSFNNLGIDIVTRDVPTNIDQVAISRSFLKDVVSATHVFADDKSLSDHQGVCVTLERN